MQDLKQNIEKLDLMIKAGKKVYDFANDDLELLSHALSLMKELENIKGSSVLPEERKYTKKNDDGKDTNCIWYVEGFNACRHETALRLSKLLCDKCKEKIS